MGNLEYDDLVSGVPISCFQDPPADFPHGIDEFRLNAALIPPPLPLVLLVFLSISLDFFFS